MKIHELKTDPEVFSPVLTGEKTYEIRWNVDRHFEVGEILYLRETQYTGEQMLNGAKLLYTGRAVLKRITHILEGPIYGLNHGWVILSMSSL